MMHRAASYMAWVRAAGNITNDTGMHHSGTCCVKRTAARTCLVKPISVSQPNQHLLGLPCFSGVALPWMDCF